MPLACRSFLLVSVWEYRDPSDSQWKPYTKNVSKHLDEQKEKGYRSVQLGNFQRGLPYIVDLLNMTQRNTDTGQVTEIRVKQPGNPFKVSYRINIFLCNVWFDLIITVYYIWANINI